jgi:hypothetical protein
MKKRLVIVSIFILLIGVISCQKNASESKSSLTSDLYTSVAEVVATQISSVTASTEQSASVENYSGLSSAYIISGEGNLKNFGMPGWSFSESDHLVFGVPHVDSCVTVSVSSSSYPREIIIEYLKGCSTHKHDKSGKIIIDLSDTITNAGAVQTITYQDFYIDSVRVDLEATLTNLGQNSSGNWEIGKTYLQTISKGDEVAVRKNNETQEWISGFETADKSDNIYYLSGSGSIIVNDTLKYSKEITSPLLYDAGCDYIKSGIVELTRNGSVAIIDYGDGTCDNKATITIDTTTQEINLRSYKFKDGSHFDKNCPEFGNKHRERN